MKTTLFVLALAIVTQSSAQGQAPPAPFAAQRPLYPGIKPVRTCESLTNVTPPNIRIERAVTEGTVCRVTAVVTRPWADDKVTVWVALPIEGWNGRFQGTGGGGMSGGSENNLRAPAAAGYVAAGTDTGHEGGSGSFALDEQGRHRWMLIRDNAYLGIHDMTVTAKALIEFYYGKPARYAYFNGCSTGGRQGLSEAQRYPADYDGILAGAPAINFPKLHVAQIWGPMLMQIKRHTVPMCRFAAATNAENIMPLPHIAAGLRSSRLWAYRPLLGSQ